MAKPAQSDTKWIFSFGGAGTDGDASLKNLLGGKGANLAEMANLGLPVPPGFTLTTGVCNAYYELGKTSTVFLSSPISKLYLLKLSGISLISL